MPSDLEYKLEETPRSPLFGVPRNLFTSQSLEVRVTRAGDQVVLAIGNADPFRLSYVEAIRTGAAWAKEGYRAKRAKRLAELTICGKPLFCHGPIAIKIGHWLLIRGSEAKFLRGDSRKVVETS